MVGYRKFRSHNEASNYHEAAGLVLPDLVRLAAHRVLLYGGQQDRELRRVVEDWIILDAESTIPRLRP